MVESEDESHVYAVALVILNVLFFLSIFSNTYASVRAVFSREHVQVRSSVWGSPRVVTRFAAESVQLEALGLLPATGTERRPSREAQGSLSMVPAVKSAVSGQRPRWTLLFRGIGGFSAVASCWMMCGVRPRGTNPCPPRSIRRRRWRRVPRGLRLSSPVARDRAWWTK